MRNAGAVCLNFTAGSSDKLCTPSGPARPDKLFLKVCSREVLMLSIDFLEKSELFKGLDDDQLAAVQTCCQEKEFRRGEMIFGKDQSVGDLYIVAEGQVDLRFDMPGRPTSDKNTISSVSEAAVFGWSSFVPPYKTTLSAYCAKNSRVVLMKREELLGLFEKNPRIGYVVTSNLSKVVGKRFHRIQDEIVSRRGHDMMFDW